MAGSVDRRSLLNIFSRTVAWLLVPVYLTGMSANLWLERRSGLLGNSEDYILFAGFGAFAVVGALLVARRPDNAISWIMAGVGFIVAIFPAAESYAAYVMSTFGRPDSLAMFGAWANEIYWVPLITLVLVFLPLYFPTGRLPSARWRPVVWFTLAVMLVLMIIAGLRGTLVGQDYPYEISNPIGRLNIHSLEEDPVAGKLLAGILLSQIAATASLIVRYRASNQIERQQLKWFFYAVALSPLLFLELPIISDLLFPLVLIGIPTAIGIAVLRYRLYDIDIIIRKTIQYSLLSALLALVYFGGVIFMQALFGTALVETPTLLVVVTLLLAALFRPLRNRVQAVIDRRFYRQKVNRQAVLERFAQTARDEVELDRLAATLVNVVEETIRPVGVSFWLKEGTHGRD